MSPELSAFLRSWSWEPTILVGLGLALGLYTIGWRRLQQRGRGRVGLPAWRAWCFVAGLLTVGVALLSPIGVYGGLFFFLHMTQHVLLILVAAPLLWLGMPLLPWLWALPKGLRHGVGRLLTPRHPVRRLFDRITRPGFALAVHLATVAIWHVPAFYDMAQGRTLVHDVQHVTFFGTALLFWWPVAPPIGRPSLAGGAAILYLVPPMLEGKLLGALITFAPQPLYDTYQLVPRVWDLSVLEDQQLSGIVMWIGGALLFFLAMIVLFLLWFNQEETDTPEVGAPETRAVVR